MRGWTGGRLLPLPPPYLPLPPLVSLLPSRSGALRARKIDLFSLPRFFLPSSSSRPLFSLLPPLLPAPHPPRAPSSPTSLLPCPPPLRCVQHLNWIELTILTICVFRVLNPHKWSLAEQRNLKPRSDVQHCLNKLRPKGMAQHTHKITISIKFEQGKFWCSQTLQINQTRSHAPPGTLWFTCSDNHQAKHEKRPPLRCIRHSKPVIKVYLFKVCRQSRKTFLFLFCFLLLFFFYYSFLFLFTATCVSRFLPYFSTNCDEIWHVDKTW